MRTPSSVMFDSAAHAASRSSLPCSTNSVVSTRTWTASCRAGSAAAVSYPNSASSTRRLRLRMSEPQAHADVVGAAWLGEGEVVGGVRSEEHTSELQSRENLVCRLLLEKKKELCNYM